MPQPPCDAPASPHPLAGGYRATAPLMGTDPDRIYTEVTQLLTSPPAYQGMANTVNPYGDGRATQRTVRATADMFGPATRPNRSQPSASRSMKATA